MIRVAYELEGGLDKEAAAHRVEKIVIYHQRVLSGLTCPIHQEPPWLKVYGRSLQGLAVSIESCCPILNEKVEARINDVSRRDQA